MKTFLTLIALALAAVSVPAAPAGAQTSLTATANVSIDGYGYRLNSMASYQRTSQGLVVTIGPGSIFSTVQPAGPETGDAFQASFTIPADVIFGFYK
jgi:hypothetical protein